MMFRPRPKSLGRDNFLKLSDREEVTGVFRGDIYTFRRHWTGQASVECSGETCPICQTDPENRPAFRFRVNFVTNKDGQWFAKIFEGGGELYDSLVNLDRKFDLSKTAVEITRRGLKQNTKYDVIPLTNMQITKEMEAKIRSIQLHALSAEEPEAAAS
jgi:hypothetical protein